MEEGDKETVRRFGSDKGVVILHLGMTEDVGLDPNPRRVTAPQQPYTFDQVQYGFAILFVGHFVTFILPLMVT
jgi:hypothetical protein